MKRLYAVIELAEGSTFDPASEEHLDDLADDLLRIAHGVAAATVYLSSSDLIADEA